MANIAASGGEFLPYVRKMLIALKLLHTAVWAVMATCVIALPFTARARRFQWTAWLSAIVLGECLVLAMNHFRCPITDWAAHYTADRAPNFDIYLPEWLARANKPIFGVLFVVGEVFATWTWWSVRNRHLGASGREENPGKAVLHPKG